MDDIGSCSQRLYGLVGAMTCTKMIDYKAGRIWARSKEAKAKNWTFRERGGILQLEDS